MNSKHSTYIFDFDGTLVDSMPCWSQSMLNVLNKSGVEYPDDIIKIITPLGNIGSAKYFKDVLKVEFSMEEMFAMMEEYTIPRYRDSILLKDGVRDYLEMLKANKFSLNVLTASPHKTLDPCLKRNGIWDMFDNVWSCDDFGTTKSDPQLYRDVVKRLGVCERDAVFFDDNIGSIKTAASAGLYTVGVYDESGKDFAQELKNASDMYIDSFSGLGLV